MKKLRTAVLAGGDSPEREVSLWSGGMALDALRRQGIETFMFDPAERPLGDLQQEGAEVAVVMLHGGSGENGEVQGALKMMGLPFTGSGVLASALAMDKPLSKMVWREAGLPTPDWAVASDAQAETVERIAKEVGFPAFVKPSCGGSSTNAAPVPVQDASALAAAIAAALGEGPSALVETLAEGGEYTMAVLDDEPLPLIKIAATGEFYDYHAKYESDDTVFMCPCDLSEEKERELQDLSLRAFALLGCRHWGRVDLILTEQGPQLLEVNTVPGMTSHSLVPMAAKAAGMDYDALMLKIWEGAA